MGYLLMILLLLTSSFLILIILLQRGRGGGLVGAFGGLGGQSAFGAKAGDVFTKVTIGVAIVWGLLCIVTVKYYSTESGPLSEGLGSQAPASQPGIQSNEPIDPSQTAVPDASADTATSDGTVESAPDATESDPLEK